MVQLQGRYQLSDYLHAQKMHLRSQSSLVWSAYIVVGIIVVVIFLGTGRAVRGDFPWSGLITPVLVLAVIALAQFVYLPRQHARAFGQQTDLSLPFEMMLSDAGFEMKNEYGRSLTKWGDFLYWLEDDTAVLLYRSDKKFQMLPKHLFQSQTEIDYLINKIQRHNVSYGRQTRLSCGMVLAIILFTLVVLLPVIPLLLNQ